jgi:transposase, IS5 family
MIRKRAGQRSFSDAILFGARIPDPKTLLDPVLRQLDEILADDELVDEVLDALRKRHPQSGRRGRPGTPAEVALRMLALKHIRQWSFEKLEWEVTGNVAYRAFCRIDAARFPTPRR